MEQNIPASIAFRADKHGAFKGQVTAVFSGEPANHHSTDLTCYAHHGQHGSCSRGWYTDNTRPATPEEYAPLLAELTNQIGYDVTVVARVKWSAK